MISSLPAGLTIEQVLGRCWVDGQYNPQAPLLKWTKECGIVVPDNTLDGVVDAAQAKFQRYLDADCQFPKARDQIDLGAEDAPFGPDQTERCLQSLSDLGLFYDQFAQPEPMDYLPWHAAYLPELLHQIDTLLHHRQNGVRWENLVFLGAATSVGDDLSVDQLLNICAHREDYSEALKDVYNPTSLYWYAPNADLVREMWERSSLLDGADGLRDVPVQWIAAPDGITSDGQRRRANTQDTLKEWAKHHTFDARHRYGTLTRTPTALRQWLITRIFLEQNMPNSPAASKLSFLCAPHAEPVSRYVVNREAGNVGWELRNARNLGIRVAA